MSIAKPRQFSLFWAVDPAGQVAVFYYSREPQVSPTTSLWLVPASSTTGETK